MKREVLVTDAAASDLGEILTYIAARSHDNAELVSDRIEQAMSSLSSFAERFALAPESRAWGKPVRSMLVNHFRVLFRVDGKRVVVIRVVHGARQLPDLYQE